MTPSQLKVPIATNSSARRVGASSAFIPGFFNGPLGGYGGEGGIRTPDRLAPMSDFESGAFNRALPPLRNAPRLESACDPFKSNGKAGGLQFE